MTNLLRPELVKKFRVPLSSDVFCSVGGPATDQPANEADALAASKFLQVRMCLCCEFVA